MCDFFVMLVLKTVICKSKLLNFQKFASLELEHYESDYRLYVTDANYSSVVLSLLNSFKPTFEPGI